MKKSIIAMIVIMILASVSVYAELSNAPDVKLTLVSQNPDPVEPGSYVELRFKLENFGYQDAEGIEVRFADNYPFSLNPGEDDEKYIGTIPGRQVSGKAFTFDYKVRVDSDAVLGDNTIKIEWKSKTTSWIKEEFSVDIDTTAPLLSITEFTSDPVRIKPGDIANIEMKLFNGAYTFIRDVKVKLNLVNIVQTAAGATVEELPFSPIGSSDEKIITKMDGRTEKSVSFDIVTSADAETKIYKLPVTLSFTDSTGQQYNQSNIISLIVGDEPDLIVGIDESEIYKSGQTGTVSIKFVNKGFSDVKFLYVKLGESPNYNILSSDDAYIGNIDSDDYETADFEIYLKSKENGYATIPLEIEYKDANNVEYTKSLNLKLKLLSDTEAEQVGLKKANNTTGIVIVIVIVVLGFIIYRVFRKRRKKKK